MKLKCLKVLFTHNKVSEFHGSLHAGDALTMLIFCLDVDVSRFTTGHLVDRDSFFDGGRALRNGTASANPGAKGVRFGDGSEQREDAFEFGLVGDFRTRLDSCL